MCDCKFCKMTRRISMVYDNLSEEVQDIVDDLYIEWEHESTEHGYYKSVLDGTWPTSTVLVLTQEEAEALVELIDNPPKVSQKLLDATKKYKERVENKY